MSRLTLFRLAVPRGTVAILGVVVVDGDLLSLGDVPVGREAHDATEPRVHQHVHEIAVGLRRMEESARKMKDLEFFDLKKGIGVKKQGGFTSFAFRLAIKEIHPFSFQYFSDGEAQTHRQTISRQEKRLNTF